MISQMSKYKLSRRGRKLQISDDSRTLMALPKDVPERTWADILQKEENDLMILEIREEIIEEAIRIGYELYMDRQNAVFTAFCAAQAWLKLIDWHFYRHDPGEEASAAPACHIPQRAESWAPEPAPAPSPRDCWCRQDLPVLEDSPEEPLQRWPSSSSVDLPVVEDIPKEYWFPGRVVMQGEEYHREDEQIDYDSYESSRSELPAADSELLQRVTDYSSADLTHKESGFSALKTTTPAEGSLQGAGDSGLVPRARSRRYNDCSRSRVLSRHSMVRSRGALAADADSRSRPSNISDCRLRSLRLDTQYEVTSEKIDTPPGEPVRRK